MRGPANANAVQKNKRVVSTGSNVRITLDAIANEYHVLDSIEVSTDADIGLRALSVDSPVGTKLFQVDVDTSATAKPVPLTFPKGLYDGVVNQEMQINMNNDNVATVRMSISYR